MAERMGAPVQVGQIIGGKYQVLRILARGGVGVVVEAKHLQLLGLCAIKLMLPEALQTPMARERFLREARACARLRGDHVVRVLDVGEVDAETPYMVLEYLEGMDLADYLTPGRPIPVPEAVRYVLQICAALAEAHRVGIVHRDLKPANVFLARLSDGTTRVKLLDFGISKILGEPPATDQSLTLDGTIVGTPFFMAPEQVRGGAIDARVDLWALGVVLYLLVTGHLPFVGNTPTTTLVNVLTCEPELPSAHVPTLPSALEAIILQCLQKNPARRPVGAVAVAEAIAPFADELAPAVSHPPEGWLRPRRKVAALIAACLGSAAVAGAAVPRSAEPPHARRHAQSRVAPTPLDLPVFSDGLRADAPASPSEAAPLMAPLAAPEASSVVPALPSVSASSAASFASSHPISMPPTPGFDFGRRH